MAGGTPSTNSWIPLGEKLGGDPVFETCPMCHETWADRDRFLSDPTVLAVGYQADLEVLETGLFLFNHVKPGCGTTLVIEAGEFVDLSEGPIYRERLSGTDECPEYCLRPEDLGPCPRSCECAYVRDILQVVRHWKKLPAG